MVGAAHLFISANTTQAVNEMQKLQTAGAASLGVFTTMGEMAAVGMAAMAGGIFAATSAVNEWQKSMVNAKAIGGLTEDQMWQLAKASTEAGRQMGIASSEIASGYLELTRAGFTDMNDIMAMNNVIMKAAVANQIAYGEAADVTIKSLNAFGIGVEDAEEKVGVLQYIANQTLAEFSTFTDVMRYAGSTSAFAGVEFEELASAMGVLTDVAMEAGIGARGMNQMLLDMIKNADEFAAFAEKMGVQVEVFSKDGAINLTEIITKFGELGITQDVLMASAEEFNVRALRSWLGLIANADRYNELLAGTGDAQEYFNRTFLAQLETIDNVLGMIREEFLSIFRNKEVIDSLTDFFFVLRGWVRDSEIGDVFKDFILVAAANLPMILNMASNLLDIFQIFAPTFIYLAEKVSAFAGGGFLQLYILGSLINSMMPSLVSSFALYTQSLEYATQRTFRLATATLWSKGAFAQANQEQIKMILTSTMLAARVEMVSIAIQGLVTSLSALVGVFMSAIFIHQMYNDTQSRGMKIAMIAMYVITGLNAALVIYNSLMAMANAMSKGLDPLTAGIIAGVAVSGTLIAAYYAQKDMQKEQQNRMADLKSQSAAEQEAWATEMGIPKAHSGIGRTKRGLVYVKDEEKILNPEQTRAFEAGVSMGRGGGGDVHIHVHEGAYMAPEFEQVVAEASERHFRRSMRGEIR